MAGYQIISGDFTIEDYERCVQKGIEEGPVHRNIVHGKSFAGIEGTIPIRVYALPRAFLINMHHSVLFSLCVDTDMVCKDVRVLLHFFDMWYDTSNDFTDPSSSAEDILHADILIIQEYSFDLPFMAEHSYASGLLALATRRVASHTWSVRGSHLLHWLSVVWVADHGFQR